MNSSIKKKNRNILIVDDEKDVLELLKIYLEAQNWKTTTTNSTSMAFDFLQNNVFFLIITDIAMPDIDGYEFIKKIEAMKIPSQIALMTGFGYNPNHTLIKINKISTYPILFKPFQFKQPKIKNTIQKAWEKYHKDIS